MNSLAKFVTGGAVQLAMREWRQKGTWRGPLSAVAIGALLGVLGPFGSQTTLSTAAKYTFWMVAALAGFLAAVAAERVLPSGAPGKGTIARTIAVAAVSAVPMTFFVAWTMGVIRPGRTFGPLQILALYPYVALIQLLIARAAAAPEKPAPPAADLAAADPKYPPDFVAKLPIDLRRDIIALEAEDHYLRVHTLHGSALVLMRLSDAAAMIDPRLGLRVHRSWWVAKDSVRALETASGRPVARLDDGTMVPISRAYLPAARAALSN